MLRRALKKFISFLPRQNCRPTIAPGLFQIELTSKCNLNCAMCARSHGLTRKTGHMDIALFKEIIIQSRRYQMPISWFHHFGETLLYPYLEEALVYFKRYGIGYGGVSSNAILLGKENRRILLAHANHVLCDVDSMSADAYSKIRNNSNHERILDNVKALIDERNKINSNCEIIIQFLRTQHNNDEEIMDMMNFFGNHQKLKYIEKGTVKHPRGDDITVYQSANIPDNRRDCCMCKTQLCILSSGEAVACCWDADGEQIIGDVRNQTLADIWQGKNHKAMQRALAKSDFSQLPLCGRCAGPGIGDRERVLEQMNVYHELWNKQSGRIIFAPDGEYMRSLLSDAKLQQLGGRLFLLEETASDKGTAPFPLISKNCIMPSDTVFIHSPDTCSHIYFDLKSLEQQGTKLIVIGSFL